MRGPHMMRQFKLGDRARTRTTQRTGTITSVATDSAGHARYHVAYDRAPQDAFLPATAAAGTDVPAELLEPARDQQERPGDRSGSPA